MKRNVIRIFLPLFVLVVFFSLPRPANAAISDWQKGASIQPTSTTSFASPEVQQSLRNLKSTGANYVTFIIPYYQTNLTSTDIQRGWDTPTDEALISGITYAHSIGLQVMLKPHIESKTGEWRANIYPSDRDTWYRVYGDILVHYGQLGKQYGVEQLCVGAELWRMASSGQNYANTQAWKDMIARVRTVYSGKLTYSANHSGPREFNEIQFWDSLDYIGISAYFPLAPGESNPTVDRLKQDWSSINSSELLPLSKRWGKPLIFTEVGYRSVVDAHSEPFSWWKTGSVDEAEQARNYEALFSFWNDKGYMQGMFLWDWAGNPNAGGSSDTGYTPQNKQAEQVIKQWYSTGTPPVGGSPAGEYTVSGVVTPTSPAVNTQATITVDVKAPGALSDAIVDVEVYNSANQKVHQQIFENQSLDTAGKQFTLTYAAPTAGDYVIKVGIFNNNWSTLYHWADNVHTYTVVSSQTPSPTPTPTPSPTASPTPSTSPSPTAQPSPGTSEVTIQYPTDGSSISGTQLFKALIPNMSLSDYKMYWQVDGGQLNDMYDSNQDTPHKEAWVDVSGWNWNGSGPYTITFVAKNNAGSILAQKSSKITIAR